MNEPSLQIGDWAVLPDRNRLESPSRTRQIEPRAMAVLLFLARRAGEVVTVEELLASVWKGAVVGDGSVYLAINQLRRALDDPTQPIRHIETIPKKGYRLAAPVRHPERAMVRSIAILPFENLTADSEQTYFGDGVTVELLNALSRIPSLRVAGATSSFRFRNATRDDVRNIGAALGVDHLLEGSVRKWGDRVRISVRLSDARTQHQLWSQTYERTLSDIFAIQDDIARAVADALQIALGIGDLGGTPGMTRNVAAYEAYLKAAALNLEWRPESTVGAIGHLQRAVALDPTFAVGWALLHATCFNGVSAAPNRAAEWRRKGVTALDRARALAPDAPEVLLQVAIHEADGGNWHAAGVAFERLWGSNEQRGTAHRAAQSRGVFLLSTGRVKAAVDALEIARAIDPLAVAFAHFLAYAYLANSDFAATFAEVDRGLGLDGLKPPLRNTALATALATGDRLSIEQRVAAFPESDPCCVVHRALAPLLDDRVGARNEIRRRASSAELSEATALAQWAAYFDDPELALELLAAAMIEMRRPFALWQPLMSGVRRLPGFKQVVQDLGLVDYWRAFGWSDFSRPLGNSDFACE